MQRKVDCNPGYHPGRVCYKAGVTHLLVLSSWVSDVIMQRVDSTPGPCCYSRLILYEPDWVCHVVGVTHVVVLHIIYRRSMTVNIWGVPHSLPHQYQTNSETQVAPYVLYSA